MKRPFKARYTDDELYALTDEWETWAGCKDSGFVLVRLMDIDRAMHALSPPHREAVFLCGFCQMTTTEAANLVGIGQKMMWRRYQRGLEMMGKFLNG